MDKLYAPWRDIYVESHIKRTLEKEIKRCIFCDVFESDGSDDEKFILYKNDKAAVILNLYPYNGGHLLVFARNHVQELYELPEDIGNLLIKLSSKSMEILKKELEPGAFNFGANIGKDAGAGIPSHMHLHIVPRWRGDTGFLTTIGSTKQVSVDLEKLYNRLKPIFNKELKL